MTPSRSRQPHTRRTHRTLRRFAFAHTARLLSVAAGAVLATSTLAAQSVPAERLPADHGWLVHLDHETAAAGPMGPIIDRIAAQPDLASKLAAIEAFTGFNVQRDLRSVTLSGPAGDQAAGAVTIEAGVLLLTGTFDAARIELAARAVPNLTSATIGGRTIYRFPDNNSATGEFFACLLDAEHAVLTTRQSDLERVIDASDGRGPTLAAAGTFPAEVLAGNQAVMLAGVNNLQAWNDSAMPAFQAALLRHVVDATMTMTATNDTIQMAIMATAADADSATRLTQIVQGLIAMGQVKADELDPVQRSVITSATVASDGNQVQASASLPMIALERMLAAKGVLPEPSTAQ